MQSPFSIQYLSILPVEAEDRAIIKTIEALAMTTQATKRSPTAFIEKRLPVSLPQLSTLFAQVASISIAIHPRQLSPFHQPLAATQCLTAKCHLKHLSQNSPRHSIDPTSQPTFGHPARQTSETNKQPLALPQQQMLPNIRLAYHKLRSCHSSCRNSEQPES